ncbi:MAG: DUF2378 family protein [Sandaracinus sp.]
MNTRLSNAEPAEVLCSHCGQSHQATYTHCPNTGKPLHVGRALIGRVIAERYRIVGLLGEGGMGAVYVADHLRIGRKVAIKRLHPELAADEKAVQRFQREARAAGATGHEHIVEILDLGYTEDGAPFLVMEYLRGLSLAQTLKKDGRLTVARASHIVGQVLAALSAVHEHGIVHRDLKPDNVFLTRHGADADWVKVLDFGISKMRHEDDGLDLTRTGAMMGTPFYMSPEQARGTKAIDHRADLYATGVILHECLTGTVPFAGENYHALLQQILRGDPPRPSASVPGIAREMDEIVLRAMATDPEKRFASARAMLEALVPFGAPRPTGTSRRDEVAARLEPSEPTLPEAPARADGHSATELFEPAPPVKVEISATGIPRPSFPRPDTAPRPRPVLPTPASPVTPPASSRGSGPSPEPRPGAATTPIGFAASANERYFFAASPDFDAERARSIVPLGRGQGGPVAYELKSAAVPSVREVTPAIGVPAVRAPMPTPARAIGVRERADGTGPVAVDDGARRLLVEPCVKGALVVGAREHVEAAYGPRIAALLDGRLDPDVRAKTEGVILPMAWMPVAALEAIVKLTDEIAGRGDGVVAEAAGRACAERELPTTHRLFMQSATPPSAIERFPQLYRSYFSRGELRAVMTGATSARVSLEGTSLEPPILAAWTGGFASRMLELTGAREVRVVMGRSERGDEKSSFTLRWR